MKSAHQEPIFETDRTSGWERSDFEKFVAQRSWKFARTMPSNPHEYTLRKEDGDAAFDSAVRYIRKHGAMEEYAGALYKVLYAGEHKFWTMGAAVDETTLINRKPRTADAPSASPPPAIREAVQLEIVWQG